MRDTTPGPKLRRTVLAPPNGRLCCLSHVPDPSLRDRDAEFLKVLVRLMVEQLERDELESRNWRLRIEATGAGALVAAL